MHALAILQDQAIKCPGVTYEDIVGALKGHYQAHKLVLA
jgi:hypothetical protein